MVSEKQEVQAGEVEQEAPKAAPKTTRTRKPKATEQAKTDAPEKAAETPAQESPTVQENTPETDAPEKAAEAPADAPAQESPADAPAQESQDQEKPADAQDDAPAEKPADAPAQEAPQANSNSLSVTNSGATTFCRVSGKTIATGQTVTIIYKNAILKSKAKRNFEQLNELAGKKRFSVEG